MVRADHPLCGPTFALDPNLIAAVMLQESGGQHLAYSHSGAVGLMQVMPRDGIAQKFMCKNGPCFTNRPTISELEDPDFNVAYGTGMLAGLNNRFGNIRDALKSYGPMDVGYSYADISAGHIRTEPVTNCLLSPWIFHCLDQNRSTNLDILSSSQQPYYQIGDIFRI
jgi:hypothetical protein